MELSLLGAIGWGMQLMVIIFILISVLLIIIILLQKGRGGGLAAAFGGAGGQSAFGSKTGDAFTKITIGFVAVFLVLAVLVSKYYKPQATIDDIPTISSPTAPGIDIEPPVDETQAETEATETQPPVTPEAAPEESTSTEGN